MPRKPKRDEDGSLEKGTFAPDVKEFVRKTLKSFFEFKEGYDQKPIPEHHLFSDESFRTVLRTPFDDNTFLFIHKNCLAKIPKQKWYRDTTVSWQVHYLIGLINDLKSLHVPKEFQAGLILLFFKFCKGLDVSGLL
jgi:hypothetical protein